MWSQYHKNKFRKLRFWNCCPSLKTAQAECVPAHSPGHYWGKQSFRAFGTGYDRLSARLETHFRIVVGIYCHNIPTHTPQNGYHGVTKVAKTANIAKMAGKCINCIGARPTPPHTNPMQLGPGNPFSAQNRKNQKIQDFQPKERGGSFFSTFLTPPPLPQNLKKVGFKWGGVWGGGPNQKLIGGYIYWAK